MLPCVLITGFQTATFSLSLLCDASLFDIGSAVAAAGIADAWAMSPSSSHWSGDGFLPHMASRSCS